VNEVALNFIRSRHVDSFQKLRVLLFLHRHRELSGDCQQLAKRLFVSVPLLEDVCNELKIAGLLDCTKNCYFLRNEPDLVSCLGGLARMFEDPVARQELLDQVRITRSVQPDRH
jgi:DNA-binding IscR family transcriptional regulator